MANREQDDFVARFMADYFAESEEHLAEVRTGLLTLETTVGTGTTPTAVLDDLFRNCHSLKGISAIAEIRDGEQLAHEMESYLRALRAGETAPTTAGVDALVHATATFEAILAARRQGAPPPAIEPPVHRLREVARARQGHVPRSAPAEAASTGRRWKVTFTPSPELVARDVKVDTIRQRLLGLGQIEAVTPRVLDAGRIAFEFVVATEDEDALRRWSADGVNFEPLPSTNTAPSAPSRPARPVEMVAGVGNVVRVELARLDELMRIVGDLVVTRSRMEDVLRRVEKDVPPAQWAALMDYSDRVERQLRDLREGVMRVRLVPVGEIFRRMPFVVRDLGRDTGKRVRIELSGQDTEIDKLLIERMLDPMLHLVRNAVSHGLEAPDERTSAGKPPEGLLRLSAVTVGETVVIEIADDGRGMDREAIAARAVAAGLLATADATLDDRELLNIISAPGFSTRDVADRASGRGVGMAVVRDTVQELGGTLDLQTQAGSGTTFRITLPLTLAITDALIVSVGDQTFAVPQSSVNEVIEVDASALTAIEGNELMVHRGGTLPVVRLGRLFGIPDMGASRMHALVIGSGAAAVGLLVSRVAGQREIVVKTVSDPLIKVEGVIGVTELGDGRVVLIVDAASIAGRLRGARAAFSAQGGMR